MQKQQMQQKKPSRYNGFLTNKNNYIWAGAICLAWDQMKNNIIKQPIKFQKQTQTIKNIVNNFNYPKFLNKDIKQEDYYAKSGYGTQVIKTINKQMDKKFPKITFPKLKENSSSQSFISYAYIFKQFEFCNEFKLQEEKKFKFNGKNVKSFTASTEKQKKNVFYYKYVDDQNFLIGIKGKNQNDSIFIYKQAIGKQEKIDEVIQTVNYYQRKNYRIYLTKIDNFQMPYINLSISRNISQLQGLKFANKSFKSYTLTKAFEALKLQINEKGVTMENVAVFKGKCCIKVEKQPKFFLLNRPFWIIMKERDRHPYLCVRLAQPVEDQMSSLN